MLATSCVSGPSVPTWLPSTVWVCTMGKCVQETQVTRVKTMNPNNNRVWSAWKKHSESKTVIWVNKSLLMQIYFTETNAAREPGRLFFFLMSLISASVFAAYSSWIKQQPLLTQHFLLLHRVAFIVKKQKPNPQEKIMFFWEFNVIFFCSFLKDTDLSATAHQVVVKL